MTLFLSTNLGLLLTPFIFLSIFYFGRVLKKHAFYIEIGVLLFILLMTLIGLDLFGFRLLSLERFMNSGHLSVAFFLLVMLAGILPKKSQAYKRLLYVRGELAIVGFLFLLPHALDKLSLALQLYNFTGLIAFILFLPLVFTSFISIRKKMNPKHWKKLHQLSYLAYLMLYIHLGFNLFIGDSIFITISQYSILYHLIFLVYFVLKIYAFFIKKKKSF